MAAKNFALPLRLYGWAHVNGDGTLQQHSGNLAISRTALGQYLFTPDVVLPANQVMPIAISAANLPFYPSVEAGIGPTTNSVQVVMYNTSPTPAVTVDNEFYFYLYTVGDTDYSVTPNTP